ncbi:hypothetical protein F5B20DRAFT_1281 [Whalleya microplaca]|nr:hypothetical protein F5B20DRAFT_1281 [Whalleya microplaca]
MIVLAVTDHHAVLCLSLCNHQDVSGREGSKFFNSHVRVYAADSSAPDKYTPIQRGSIGIWLSSGLHFLESVWINCQLPWAVQPSTVSIADIGYLETGQLNRLKKEYCEVQAALLSTSD